MLALPILAKTALGLGLAAAAQAPPRRANAFELKSAAVAALAQNDFPGSDGATLLLTTFSPVGKDQVTAIPSVGRMLHAGAVPAFVELDPDAKWPNMATFVPASVLQSKAPAVLEAGGFFVSPTKATGEVALLDLSQLPRSARKTKISTDKASWFYHEAQFLDVDGDGRQDVVAARAHKPILGAAKSELVALIQPAAAGAPWAEKVLTGDNGPGVGFALVSLDGDSRTQVVASQFFAEQDLAIWWCGAQHWSSCDGNASSVVIDTDPDRAGFFSVSWQDLNGDGRKDLLASTNEANGRGGVYAYEQPAGDWRTQKWIKHTLAKGYKPTMPFLPGRGSPGTAVTFFVNASEDGAEPCARALDSECVGARAVRANCLLCANQHQSRLHHANCTNKAIAAWCSSTQSHRRPSILVSADDGGFVDLLTPIAGQFWGYQKQRVLNSTGTVGSLAVGDFNGDGWSDFAVPLYAENKVALYTFAP